MHALGIVTFIEFEMRLARASLGYIETKMWDASLLVSTAMDLQEPNFASPTPVMVPHEPNCAPSNQQIPKTSPSTSKPH